VKPGDRNQIVLLPNDEHSLKYEIQNKDGTLKKKGIVKQSETVESGWMGLKLRLLRYLPKAHEIVTFVPSPTSSPASTSAVKLSFRGQTYWLGVDNVLRLYLDDRAYLISFGHRQLDLAFPVQLDSFVIGKYQGTDRASSYESVVSVPDRGQVHISMNEPMKYQGFTFYQSSFEKNEKGEPVVSVLSVNYDPGRWIKYLGSFLIVFGSILLFYFKRAKWLKKGGVA
jgi:cytochrome c biogenesis protein ResB